MRWFSLSFALKLQFQMNTNGGKHYNNIIQSFSSDLDRLSKYSGNFRRTGKGGHFKIIERHEFNRTQHYDTTPDIFEVVVVSEYDHGKQSSIASIRKRRIQYSRPF